MAVETYPGKNLGIASLSFSIANCVGFAGAGLIGIILGIIALKKSAAVKQANAPALIGIIVGGISLLLTGIVVIVLIWLASLGTFNG